MKRSLARPLAGRLLARMLKVDPNLFIPSSIRGKTAEVFISGHKLWVNVDGRNVLRAVVSERISIRQGEGR